MVAKKDRSVLFLRDRLKPVIAPFAKARQDLLDNLQGDSFRKREAAERELRKVVELCEQDLLKEKGTASQLLEYLTRIEAILKTNVISDPQRLQQLRGLAVLEYIGTPEALSVIETLAGGAEGSIITLEAREIRRRLMTFGKREFARYGKTEAITSFGDAPCQSRKFLAAASRRRLRLREFHAAGRIAAKTAAVRLLIDPIKGANGAGLGHGSTVRAANVPNGN